MHGLVTSKDVLLNLRLVWTEFGPAVTLRCLRAMLRREATTFLDVALKEPLARPCPRRARTPRVVIPG
jgi:hypothetical protein